MMIKPWMYAVLAVALLIGLAVLVWSIRRWLRSDSLVFPTKAARRVVWADALPSPPTRQRSGGIDLTDDPKSMAQLILGSVDDNDRLKWCAQLFAHQGNEDQFRWTSNSVGREATLDMCRDLAEMTLN